MRSISEPGRRTPLRRWLILALLCSALGCEEPPPDSAQAPPETPNSTASPVPDSAEAQVPTPEPPAAAAVPLLALDPEGLRLVDRQSGRTRSIAFGSPASTAVESTSQTLGAPVQRGASSECGTDYASWEGGLTITLRSDRFVGWFARGETPSLTTMSGIGVGSTRADLESVYVAQVAPSSLGIEFSAGGMSGLLSSAASDGRITHLWAGEVCLAR